MLAEDFDIPFEDEAEVAALVQRYEAMLGGHSNDYFDEEEFEVIINHYFENNKSSEALQAADVGNLQHPFSSEMKVQYAHALIHKGDVMQALQILEKIEKEIINDPEVFFLKGLAHLRKESAEQTLHFFEDAITYAEDEDRVTYLMNTATALMEYQEYKLALPYIEQAFQIDPNDIEIVNELGFCHERLGNLNESMLFYERYVKEVPSNDNIWYNLGTIYGRQSFYDKAIQAFQLATVLNDKHASAYYNLASTYVQQARYEKAIEIFQTYLTIEPNDEVVYLALGECFDSLQLNDDAIKSFSKAIELNSEFAEAHYELSMSYSKDERLSEALLHIHRAISLDIDCAEYWFTLGVLLLQFEEPSMSLDAFTRTVKIDKTHVDAWLAMVEIVKINGVHEAIQLLQQASSNNPDNDMIKEKIDFYTHQNNETNI